MHDLRVSHLLVAVGINDSQESVYILICLVHVLDHHIHAQNQLFKLCLINDAILVCVDRLEEEVELLQEALVHFQLIVQYAINEFTLEKQDILRLLRLLAEARL